MNPITIWNTRIEICPDSVLVNDHSLSVNEMLHLVILWLLLVFVCMMLFIWLFMDAGCDVITLIILVVTASAILGGAASLDFILVVFDVRNSSSKSYIYVSTCLRFAAWASRLISMGIMCCALDVIFSMLDVLRLAQALREWVDLIDFGRIIMAA